MSLVRKRTSSSSSILVGKNNSLNANSSALKKKPLTKPVWDATNNDLNTLKLSNEEIERRKLAHQSKNAELVKFEKQRQSAVKSAKKDDQNRLHSRSQLALLKEILYDDDQLKNLILKSDSTLRTVQEFFKEDSDTFSQKPAINKKQVKINMTLAPNITDLNESNLPHNNPKKYSNITAAKVNNINNLSDNELKSVDSSDDESESLNVKLKQAKSSGDFGKYRQLLEFKQQLINKKLNSLSVSNTQTQRQPNELDECIKILTEQQETSARPSNSNDHSNNDTEKINRLKSLIKNYASSVNLEDESNCKENCSILRGFKQPSLSNLNDEFKKALTDLENKFYEFEKGVGKKKPSDCSVFKSILNGSNSGSSTLTLIKIISTLLDYQKDALQEINFEKLKSQEATKQLDIHRKLIDGLTNEILCVKEQNEKINSVYINHITQQAKLEAELDQVKIILKNLMQPNQFHQESIDSQAIYRPKQLEQAYKSRSQLGSMASINTINENKYPLDEALNEVKGDRFVERLNAMLQNEAHFGSASCQNFLSNNNRMQNLSLNNNNNNNNTKPSSIRSASAFQFESSGDNFNCDSFLNNKQLMEKFNTQIQEISQTAKPKVQDNLDKLKQEQQMLKDQINMLNKQRESAQIELEVLSLNAGASSKANGLNENFYKATLIQSFQNSQCTPNMSPIPAENIFQEGIEAKSSASRFNMPSATLHDKSPRNSENMNNKNRN